MSGLARNAWRAFRPYRTWFLTPIALVFLLITVLLMMTEWSTLAPFLYFLY